MSFLVAFSWVLTKNETGTATIPARGKGSTASGLGLLS
jgi:hypothetical protein